MCCVLCQLTALETLVERRITGFPVIDDDWKLVTLPWLSFWFGVWLLIRSIRYYFFEVIRFTFWRHFKISDIEYPNWLGVPQSESLLQSLLLKLTIHVYFFCFSFLSPPNNNQFRMLLFTWKINDQIFFENEEW
jgi:hypothetical protein